MIRCKSRGLRSVLSKLSFCRVRHFFEGSDVKTRLRCQLIACLALVPNLCWGEAFLEHPAPKISALWGRDGVECITSMEGVHESRRYVCRFCTSRLDRVKEELLNRLHSNSDKKVPKQQTTTQTKRHQKEGATCCANRVAFQPL